MCFFAAPAAAAAGAAGSAAAGSAAAASAAAATAAASTAAASTAAAAVGTSAATAAYTAAVSNAVFGFGIGAGSTAAAAATTSNALLYASLIGSTVSAIGTPIMQYMGQQQQAKYQEQLYDYNRQVAETNLASQYMMLSRRQAEEQKKFGQEMGIIARRGAEARATALVSSVESGVSGLSVDSLMNNYYRQQSEYLTTTQQQAKASMFQSEMEKQQARAGYQGQVLSAMPTAPGGSLIGAGLQITGGLSGMYSDLYMNTVDRQTLRTALRI